MERLKKRKDFLKVARGARAPRRGFLLQSLQRKDVVTGLADDAVRVGFTVTKKTGNSVVRNRIRRRLREAVRLAGAPDGAAGLDLVLIGRHAAKDMPFAELQAEVASALKAATRGLSGGKRPKGADRASAQDNRAPSAAPSEEDTRP